MNDEHFQFILGKLKTFHFKGRCIPKHMHQGVALYISKHQPPGDFLRAVLQNDLQDACGRADDMNIEALHVYCAFLYNHAPSGCWGSKGVVKEWLSQDSSE